MLYHSSQSARGRGHVLQAVTPHVQKFENHAP
eukprot:SAG11_NODE_2838_length_2917_cov_5.779178_5_plen_31_part_01